MEQLSIFDLPVAEPDLPADLTAASMQRHGPGHPWIMAPRDPARPNLPGLSFAWSTFERNVAAARDWLAEQKARDQ